MKVKLGVLAVLAVLACVSVAVAAVTVDDSAYFYMPDTGVYIRFAGETTLNSVVRENNTWYFNGYGFTSTANVTITAFFAKQAETRVLNLTLDAPAGNSTTIISGVSEPANVTGVAEYVYEGETLTLIVTHESPVDVTVTWMDSIADTPSAVNQLLIALLPLILAVAAVSVLSRNV